MVEDEDGFYVEAASGNTGWGGSPHGQEEPFEELQGTGPYEQQDVVAEHFVGVADNHGASEAMTQEACEDSLGSLGLGGTPADALMPQESQASCLAVAALEEFQRPIGDQEDDECVAEDDEEDDEEEAEEDDEEEEEEEDEKVHFEVEGEGSTTIISTNDVDPSVSAIGEPGSPQTEEEPSDEEEVNALEDELQLMKEQEGFQ